MTLYERLLATLHTIASTSPEGIVVLGLVLYAVLA
jgi:hypothetical protein